MRHIWKLSLISCCFVILIACQSKPKVEEIAEENEEFVEVDGKQKDELIVTLINEEEVEVGKAILQEGKAGVEVTIEAAHLPVGSHGFHIHDQGVCEAPSFESAGGHFNPTNKMHGFKHPEGPHAGDLENLEVGEDGTGETTFLNEKVTLQQDDIHSLFTEDGSSLIIHEKADDYESQPAGDAGGRIACGVIVPKSND